MPRKAKTLDLDYLEPEDVARAEADTGAPWQPPPGRVLVHNQVLPPFGRHLDRLNENGFRAWTQPADAAEPPLEPCACDFAPHVAAHYRVAAAPSRRQVARRPRIRRND
jgi:hypothetical protein